MKACSWPGQGRRVGALRDPEYRRLARLYGRPGVPEMTLPKPRACAYIQVVNQQGPFRIPSTSALTAFESAARHGNFSRAAEELRTSQPTISRQITLLEKHLSVKTVRAFPHRG